MYLKRIDKRNLIAFLIPFCLFMFLLLVFSPGIISYDSNNQWEQIVSGNINNAHPFFTTYFMLLLSKIWNSPTVVLVFQVFIFSYFWMNIARIIRENNKKSFKKILIYTIVISFIPIISLYSITLWKDILYSYYLMFIIYYIYKGIKNNFDYSYLDTLNVGILVTLVFCYRHNGMIVAFLLLISFFIIFLKNKLNMKKIILTILVFLSLNGLISIPKNFYLEKLKKNEIPKESLSTIDSYMVWMYGAHLHDDNISEDDLKKLNNVIPIDEWKIAYNPYLINNIGFYEKDVVYYNENKDYFRKLFIETSLKHPLTIIEHYLKADSLLWSPIPLSGRYVYTFDYTDWWPYYEFNNGELYGYEGSKIEFPFIKKIVEKLTSYTLRFPISIIYYPALALYASMLLVYMLIKQNKNKKYWLLLTPCLFNTLSLLPINLAQDLRYVYINYLTLLVVGLIFIVEYDFTKIKIFLNKIVKKTSK